MLPAALLLLLPAPVQSAEPGLRRFTVDPAASEVGFDGTSTLHDFTGVTRKVGGEVHADPRHLAGTAGGRIWADAASLDTDSSGRDEEMRQRLDVGHHPRIGFVLDAMDGSLDAWTGTARVKGRFVIQGVSRAREFSVRLHGNPDGTVLAEGELRFNMTDHGIEPPVVVVITVDDEVRVWFKVLLRPLEPAGVPARRRVLTLHERVEPLGGEAGETTREETIWQVPGTCLWERPADGTWVRGRAGGALVLGLQGLEPLPAPEACDRAFEETRRSAAAIRERLAALPAARREALEKKLGARLDRLEQAASLAPAGGAAEVRAGDGVTRILLGGTVWVTLGGLEGDAPFPALLLGLDGLPAEVRAALGALRGTPRSVELRTVSPSGVRTLRMEVAAPGEGRVPEWALADALWRTPGR